MNTGDFINMLEIFQNNKLVSVFDSLESMYKIYIHSTSKLDINQCKFKGSGKIVVGPNTFIGSNIFENSYLEIGSNCVIKSDNLFQGYGKIQSHVKIGSRNHINNNFKIWKYSNIEDFNFFNNNVIIEDHVNINNLISFARFTVIPAYSNIKMIDGSYYYYNSFVGRMEGKGSLDDLHKHMKQYKHRRFYGTEKQSRKNFI